MRMLSPSDGLYSFRKVVNHCNRSLPQRYKGYRLLMPFTNQILIWPVEWGKTSETRLWDIISMFDESVMVRNFIYTFIYMYLIKTSVFLL